MTLSPVPEVRDYARWGVKRECAAGVPGDAVQDLIRCSGPDERFGIFVVNVDVFFDGRFQFTDTVKRSSPNPSVRQFGKSSSDQIEPGTVSWREMNMEPESFRQPLPAGSPHRKSVAPIPPSSGSRRPAHRTESPPHSRSGSSPHPPSRKTSAPAPAPVTHSTLSAPSATYSQTGRAKTTAKPRFRDVSCRDGRLYQLLPIKRFNQSCSSRPNRIGAHSGVSRPVRPDCLARRHRANSST